MKLKYTIEAVLDDNFWGFSDYLNNGKLDEIAKEQILDLISEDPSAALKDAKQTLKLIP